MTGDKNSSSGDYADAPSYPVIDPPDGSLWAFLEDEFAQWRIVLVEFIHLLGLFLRHARQAKSARATAVLFEQMMRHLMILERMPGHDGYLVLHNKSNGGSGPVDETDYQILFGPLTVQSNRNPFVSEDSMVSKRMALLYSGLEQAFEYLPEQRIDALYFELPGGSAKRTDQLRLSLNIVARYHAAVANATSITFRYFGRALTIPLIRDNRGNPDPNLMLVAGLNNLTTVNARALIKQAEAYGQMKTVLNSNRV